MNNPVFLGLSILDLIKSVMYEFWYDYINLKYGEKSKVCKLDIDNFIVHDIYKDIAKDVDTRFETSNFQLDRTLPKGRNKNVIGLMKMN